MSIIPRGAALGVTMFLPTEDRHLMTEQQTLARIAMALGGRVAEEIVFGEITTGAPDDIKRATRLARAMVCELGMSEKLGPIAYGENEESVFLGREMTLAPRGLLGRDRARDRPGSAPHHRRAARARAPHRHREPREARPPGARRCSSARRSTPRRSTPRSRAASCPRRQRVIIPTWAEKRGKEKAEKKRPASIFGAPKPAPSG